MALLRILIIGLLVLFVLRLVARLAAVLERRQARPEAPARSALQPRRLVACPVCGDYFEPDHGLRLPGHGANGEPLTVCSAACRARRAAGGERT